MALIKCQECGREISDKAASCPGCGCPVEIEFRVSAKIFSEFDIVVDDIIEKYNLTPENQKKRVQAIRELRERTNVDLKTAMDAIDVKVTGSTYAQKQEEKNTEIKKSKQELKERRKENWDRFCNTFGGGKVARCPKCHSTSISYQDKISVGRAVVGGTVAGGTGAVLGGLTGKKGYAVCLNCGKRWKI